LLCRNIRSIETRLMRKVLASHSPSPGPGHYSSMTTQKEASAVSPPPKSVPRPTDWHLSSPGKSGYSFGKGKLEKCMPYHEENTIQLEFRRSTFLSKSSPASPNSAFQQTGGSNTSGHGENASQHSQTNSQQQQQHGGGGGGALSRTSSNPSLLHDINDL
jgi:hypothetical protein